MRTELKRGDRVVYTAMPEELQNGTIVKIFHKERRAWVKYNNAWRGRDIWGAKLKDLQIRATEYIQAELFND